MRIRNGRQQVNENLMNNTSMNRVVGLSMVFLACLPLSVGCSSERSAAQLLETTTARAQADALVHDTQAELAALRRDLAAARIATSKQEGEATELRRNTIVLDADRAELRKMLEQAHAAANALQIEQDALKQTLAQTQAVNLVRPNPSAPTKLDETDVQADMKELNARMVLLTDELAQLKQRFSNKVHATTTGRTNHKSAEQAAEVSPERVVRDETLQPRIVPSAVLLAPSEAMPRPGRASDRSPQQRLIRVQPGDSLWKLAHDHVTTIEELKRINGLTSDVIHDGQRLILPSRHESEGRRCARASHCLDPVNEISGGHDPRP
jgi:hypothetical protein